MKLFQEVSCITNFIFHNSVFKFPKTVYQEEAFKFVMKSFSQNIISFNLKASSQIPVHISIRFYNSEIFTSSVVLFY